MQCLLSASREMERNGRRIQIEHAPMCVSQVMCTVLMECLFSRVMQNHQSRHESSATVTWCLLRTQLKC